MGRHSAGGRTMSSVLFNVGWRELVVPTHSVAEMVVRGTIMYIALFVLLRVILKAPIGRARRDRPARRRADRGRRMGGFVRSRCRPVSGSSASPHGGPRKTTIR